MNKTVEIMFRKYPDGTEIAVFPYEIWNDKGDVTTYQIVGQHGPADYDHIISKTVPCERPALYNHLFTVGYECRKAIKRRNYDKYLTAWRVAREPHILEHEKTIRQIVKRYSGKNCHLKRFAALDEKYTLGPTLFLFWLKPVGYTRIQPNGDIWVKTGYASETSIIQVIKKPKR